MNVPDLVRQLLASGIKQEDLAKELRVTQPTVSRWLKGADPRGRHRDKIIDIAAQKGLISLPNIEHRAKSASPSKFLMVPVISWVSAGKLVEPTSQIPNHETPTIPIGGLGSGEWFALLVQGTSMNRVSPDGATIIINRREKTLVDGKAYVISVRGEVTYKLWRAHPARLEPYSTDPANEPIYLDRRNPIEVIGRVRRSFIDL